MRLKGEDGTSFELKIEGYQFPEIQDDRWDSNWLVVSGRVAHPRGNWSFRHACLTTFELEQLARWFDTVAVGKPKSAEGYFTEPNLEFRYVKGPAAVDVRLGHECAPPRLASRDARLEGVVLRFPLTQNDPKEAARSLREYIKKFPPRGPLEGAEGAA